ncbi:hypothetical protein Poly51_06680 [Rubripirellula tenax]|uniref:Uncharacterized protein n=1 Tax=Rubripirellula tenax TaxID=2528015 RepID=A0A5C6FIH6_9BACT|nr:hypothetical protein [Rubripirellula tenax]TWU60393.1 hypothetical protein Poly51_06680 [Rubripirellula tenax]
MTGSSPDQVRIARLESLGETSVTQRSDVLRSTNPIVGLTSSRLGRDVFVHRRLCQFLCRSLLDCRTADASVAVAKGSAIEPWAVRAAKLFNVPLLLISVDENDGDISDVVIRGMKVSRDAAVITLSDRVDAIHVRKGGNVERHLRDRILRFRDASTRVAVSVDSGDASQGLIKDGAIGWYLGGRDEDPAPDLPLDATQLPRGPTQWMHTDGQWLVHCTRARQGPWPGETVDQYRDAVLTDHPRATRRGPIDALQRIVQSRSLIASAVTTAKNAPVVCFSSLPMAQILQRRCFRPHLGRWDYEPFGIAIRTSALIKMGVKPVIYGQPGDRSAMHPEDRYRFQAVGKTYDWRSEREWRSKTGIDLGSLSPDDVRVFAKTSTQARDSLHGCPWPVTWIE